MYKIYALYHKDTLLYVGYTKDMKQRFDTHICKSSHNRLVREYMDTHGRDRSEYRMELLETVPSTDLGIVEAVEHSYVDMFCPPCNANDTGQAGAPKGVPLSEEAKQKMSAAKKGVPLSEETKQKISAALTGVPKPWQRGVPLSEETKAKLSAAKKGENNHSYRHDLRKKASEIVEWSYTMSYAAIGRMFNASAPTIKKVIEEANGIKNG